MDAELSYYQPVYMQVQLESGRMYVLGSAIFVINTIISVLIAIWISRSITIPVGQLVKRAGQIARGQLRPKSAVQRSRDELGLLSDSFEKMSDELLNLIEREKEHVERDRLVKELELQALQSQINPHFLFNTLNVLSKLALLEGAEKTSDLIVSMSNLMRYNLRQLDQPVTLGEELEHVKEYFVILQTRFRNRIQLKLNIDQSVLHVPIPALTLQPLVENAFQHGLERMEKGGTIQLSMAAAGDHIRIVITDNGAGMDEDTRQALLRLEAEPGGSQSTGLGTRNVFKRLQLFYGTEDLVSINSSPGNGTTITLLIPCAKEDDKVYVPTADRG
ncbi:Sensor histidine kinase YpdA [compost metagenome]